MATKKKAAKKKATKRKSARKAPAAKKAPAKKKGKGKRKLTAAHKAAMKAGRERYLAEKRGAAGGEAAAPKKRGPGRPKGSKNKRKAVAGSTEVGSQASRKAKLAAHWRAIRALTPKKKKGTKRKVSKKQWQPGLIAACGRVADLV